MKFKYVTSTTSPWKLAKSKLELLRVMDRLPPNGFIMIKKDCKHKKTFMSVGVRICKICGEQLEDMRHGD